MNRVIRRLAIGLLACYALLFVQLNVWQVGKRADLRANPLNNRESVRQFNAPRGPFSFNPVTQNSIHNIYIREVAEMDGRITNKIISTIPEVREPNTRS